MTKTIRFGKSDSDTTSLTLGNVDIKCHNKNGFEPEVKHTPVGICLSYCFFVRIP